LGVLDPGNESSEAREVVGRDDVRVFKDITVDGGVSRWRQFLEKRISQITGQEVVETKLNLSKSKRILQRQLLEDLLWYSQVLPSQF
jgi:hypothetical protein